MLVAHLGTTGAVPVWSSGAVAAHTSGIDVIIDGHSHEQYTRVDKNKDGKDVLVEQTGTKLASVGKITIHDDGTIMGELVKGLTAVDADVKRLVDEELAQVEAQLAKPVGTTTVDLVTDVDGEYRMRSGETNLGNFVADAFRASVHADVALVNGGGFREPISTGKVTYKTLAPTSTRLPTTSKNRAASSVRVTRILPARGASQSLSEEERICRFRKRRFSRTAVRNVRQFSFVCGLTESLINSVPIFTHLGDLILSARPYRWRGALLCDIL